MEYHGMMTGPKIRRMTEGEARELFRVEKAKRANRPKPPATPLPATPSKPIRNFVGLIVGRGGPLIVDRVHPRQRDGAAKQAKKQHHNGHQTRKPKGKRP